MPSQNPRKPPLKESQSSALSKFNRALHQSTQQIELHIQTAQDAADLAREHAARAKESAEKAGEIDVLQIIMMSVGISALLTVGSLALVKQNILNEVQQSRQVQRHEQIRK
ncbi:MULTISPECIES: hypothetical protein [Leptolyngbya]|uniref:hypothetical protein n=1 Tax=Leptolyngbya TaxID=47251 RepID=UPI0016863AAC|nr:hypothetical protein [Leptolyngbya sp. FACHB-1624]MBD1860020.1 hypothetical protein [Leptolyngbya sp. FACHB-1624]